MYFLHCQLWMSPVLLLVMISLPSESSAQQTDYLLWDKVFCHQTRRVENSDVTDHYLKLKRVAHCKIKSVVSKACSITYKLSDLLYKAYRLCGYFDDISVDCDTTIKMDYYLAFNVERSFKTFTCTSRPRKYCAPDGRELRISTTSKDYCKLKGKRMKIRVTLELLHSDMIRLNSHCRQGPIYRDSGVILSQFDPQSTDSHRLCELELRPPRTFGRLKFCMTFITYLTGADLIVTVNDCVMKFGDSKMTLDKVCQPFDNQFPVTVGIAHGQSSMKHFYLFHYSFEERQTGSDVYNHYKSEFCEKEEIEEEEDDSDGLKTYQIVLICFGVFIFLIVFYCSCCKNKSIKEPRSGSNSIDINSDGDEDDVIRYGGGDQIIYPRQTIISPTPGPTAPDLSSPQEAPTPEALVPVAPTPQPNVPSAPPAEVEPPDYYSLFPQGTDSSNI